MSTTTELMVDGNRLPKTLSSLRETWAFREVIWAFAERNVRVKYKQAVLGVVWALLQPLAFLAVFVLVFGRMGGAIGQASTYPIAALSALVPWFFFQTAVSFGAQSLLTDGALLKKVYFAREAPVLGAVLGAGLDFAIGFALLAVLAPLLGMRWSWTLILALPLWAMLAVLASGVALAFAALTVYYRDFRYALPLVLQLWMFASPVAYPLASLPQQWRLFYLAANPAAGILEAFRSIVALGQFPDGRMVGVSLLMTVAIAWLGFLLFKRMEPDFSDAV